MNKVKLRDIAEINRKTFPIDDFDEILYLDTSSVTKGVFDNFIHLSKNDTIPSRAKRAIKDKTIIYSTVRPNLQHFGIFENPQENIVVSTGFVTIDVNDNLVDPKYLYYNLTQDNYTNALHTIATNNVSSYPSINPSDLENLELEIPKDIQTQAAIAYVLSSLDDKIELNNKINKELENLAKTIYEYWFVQNADKRWKRKKIGKIAEVIRGSMITEKQTKKGNVKVVAGGLDYSCFHSEFNREKNTVTISGSGANAGFINFWHERIFASDCTTVRGETDIDTIFIYQHLKNNQENIFRLAKGSAQPHVYPSDIKDIWFYEIPKNVKNKLSPIFTAINDQIAKNLSENNTLAQLRDFLLPLLMNGQVKVNNKK